MSQNLTGDFVDSHCRMVQLLDINEWPNKPINQLANKHDGSQYLLVEVIISNRSTSDKSTTRQLTLWYQVNVRSDGLCAECQRKDTICNNKQHCLLFVYDFLQCRMLSAITERSFCYNQCHNNGIMQQNVSNTNIANLQITYAYRHVTRLTQPSTLHRMVSFRPEIYGGSSNNNGECRHYRCLFRSIGNSGRMVWYKSQ